MPASDESREAALAAWQAEISTNCGDKGRLVIDVAEFDAYPDAAIWLRSALVSWYTHVPDGWLLTGRITDGTGARNTAAQLVDWPS